MKSFLQKAIIIAGIHFVVSVIFDLFLKDELDWVVMALTSITFGILMSLVAGFFNWDNSTSNEEKSN